MSNVLDHQEEYSLLPGLSNHSRVDLGPVRSPIQKLERLGESLGIELFIKRDDAQPLGLGGNKVRQLEYYLGPARDQNADTVLITGAVQSNFVRLCAAACRRLGMQPVVQLEDRVDTNDPLYKNSGNVLIDQLLGAEIHYLSSDHDEAAADANLDRLAEKLITEGRSPYVIHLGVEHPPLGSLGYALAAAETRLQFESLDATLDHVVIPTGSGITHAGFLTGAHALDWDIAVQGICVRREKILQQPRIEQRVTEVSELLGLAEPVPAGRVLIHDDVLYPGYGQLNSQVETAITRAAHLEGVLLDPVYSGRSMAGLIDLVNRQIIKKNETVLFFHTGGLPGLFAYQHKLGF